MLQYVVANDKKGADPAPIIGKLEDVELSRKEPGPPTGPGSKGASDIAKKRHEVQLEKIFDRINTLEDNMTNLYSLVWGQCADALQQGLCGHAGFEKKDIELDAKWSLKQIKLMMQGIKEEKQSNTYDSMYKLIRQLFNY